MKIKKKILVGYSVSFILMSMVFIWAVINLVSLGKASAAILQENYRSILAAENMVNVLERQDSGVLLLIFGEQKIGVFQFRENESAFLQWLARAKDNITIKGEAEIVQAIETEYSGYRLKFYDLIHLNGDEISSFQSKNIYNESLLPIFLKVREACIALRNLNERTMYKASLKAGAVAKRAIWSTVVVAVSALFIALIFSIFLAERIVQPLRGFVEATKKLSSGDCTIQVPIESADEFGHLAREFNRMTDMLRDYQEMNIDRIISEKNKGEAILASIEDGLVVFDKDLRVSEINPAARRILNLELHSINDMHCTDIIPDSSLFDIIKKTIDTGIHTKIPDEHRIIALPIGKLSRHYLFSVTVVRGRNRDISGIVLLLRDVTHLKEVERMKSEFVMAASHELRTPLTSIGMSIDLLLEHVSRELSPKDRELLLVTHDEILRMKALVNDLLDLSRIEAGKIALDFSSVPVKNLFNHVYSVFSGQLDKKQIKLTVELPDDLPNVRADANKITWVLTNLVSNAIRYLNEGGEIKLMASRIGEHIYLSVNDNGPGIPEDYQAKIFQKFIQVKGRESGGTGLGLAICKEIVRANGGTIWVESKSGRGSTFIFTLPVAT